MTSASILLATITTLAILFGIAGWSLRARLRDDPTQTGPGLLFRVVRRAASDQRVLEQPGVLARASDAVDICRRCPHTERCRTWLAADHNGVCPDFCPNAEFVTSLRRQK